MNEVQKSAWFSRFFTWHARGKLRHAFGHVYVSGRDEARRALGASPLLVVANHTA